jgi:hypothetical protein
MAMSVKNWCGLLTPLIVSACAGSGDGLDANGRPLDPNGGGGGALTPDLASIQANVFTPFCTQCHVGANAPQGLRLDAASSYGSLVGVASSEAPQVLRVKPGEPGNSYLVQKLEGRAAVGARMPFGQPALPDATVQVIRQWIADGAPRTITGAGTAFAVQSVSITATQVAIEVTRPVDASLVNGTTVLLERASDSSVIPGAVAVRTEVSPYSDVMILATPDQPLTPGRYRLVLRGTGPAAIADGNATLLDGDRDGRPGGDASTALVLGATR